MQRENWQEQLHKLLNCDLKSLYPVAREKKRKLYFFVGPTNSGKTHRAMQELIEADCGVYLAPLRLLALENYEYLNAHEIATSLITGEEEIIDEDAGHICSTIEMVNFNYDVDLAVIDEIQMIEDPDRGWAWVNAIVGVPADKVIMTGSVNALDAVKQIAKYLDEELEVVKFQRKNPLEVLSKAIPLKEIPPKSALVAFSRADVLNLKNKLSKQHKVSVIYGNLSPEVRREEARRFREGESSVLVATDAIAMGLNLPIQTLLFSTDTKFDGISKRKLIPNEVIQIAGRAGRYGHHEVGYIGATSRSVLKHIASEFYAPLHTIKGPFQVKATNTQIEALSKHLNTKSLHKILLYFSKHMNFTGPFIAANISAMIELAKIIDNKKGLSLEDKYMLVQAPVSTKSPLIKKAYFFYVNAIIENKIVHYKPSIRVGQKARNEQELLRAEDEVKKISLYLWIAYKLPELFVDVELAGNTRLHINQLCQKALKAKKLHSSPKKEAKDKPSPRSRRRNHYKNRQR
ncbi:MAG: RNA helicase [Epsilonproteobacteria bacterium]|nr:RNA helicase [Campylobacterota bacterium]